MRGGKYDPKNAKHVAKYTKTHYFTFLVRFYAAEEDQIRAAAEALGLSVNGYIAEATREKMKRDGFTVPPADEKSDI